MPITINIYYHGDPGKARQFAEEMTASGIVSAIRQEPGNLKYAYYLPMDDPDTILLIDQWQDQKALDIHHQLPLMQKISELREKYDLHMVVQRFIPF